MTDQIDPKDALRWFIERFIPEGTGRTFALRENRLIEMSKNERYMQQNKEKRIRYSRYQFGTDPDYDTSAYTIAITPAHPAASWASGTVHLTDLGYMFTSLPQLDLFAQLDKPRGTENG